MNVSRGGKAPRGSCCRSTSRRGRQRNCTLGRIPMPRPTRPPVPRRGGRTAAWPQSELQGATATAAHQGADGGRGIRAATRGEPDRDQVDCRPRGIVGVGEIADVEGGDPMGSRRPHDRVAPHMCDQVVRPLLDQGAGGRSPGLPAVGDGVRRSRLLPPEILKPVRTP